MPHPTARFITVAPDAPGSNGILTPTARALPLITDWLSPRHLRLIVPSITNIIPTPAAAGILIWHDTASSDSGPVYPGLPGLLTGYPVPPQIPGPAVLTGSVGDRHAIGLNHHQLELIYRAFVGWIDDYPTTVEARWLHTITGWLNDPNPTDQTL